MRATDFQRRRAVQGYCGPMQRDGCRNCRHRSPEVLALENGAAYTCKLGGFFVALGGICEHHQVAGIAAVPRPEGQT